MFRNLFSNCQVKNNKNYVDMNSDMRTYCGVSLFIRNENNITCTDHSTRGIEFITIFDDLKSTT